MDRKALLKALLGKKELSDYTDAIMFLLTASFFMYFAVKPALSIAFTLRREAVDLKKVNTIYENNIMKLLEIQSNLELSRDKKYLLDEAIPLKPQTDEMLSHIISSATAHRLIVEVINVNQVKLISGDKKDALPDVEISLKLKGDYSSVVLFTKEILNQRRLKSINQISIAVNDEVASESANLSSTVNISGFYR